MGGRTRWRVGFGHLSTRPLRWPGRAHVGLEAAVDYLVPEIRVLYFSKLLAPRSGVRLCFVA